MNLKALFAASVLAMTLSTAGVSHAAGLVGSTVQIKYYFPDMSSTGVDIDSGPITIQNGTSFTLTDPTYGFDTFARVTFGSSQIVFTNLTSGIYPATPFDGVEFSFLSGPEITSVTESALSSPLFAPGSVLTYTSNKILLNLSGTCSLCVGAVLGQGGENIVLNITSAAPEPSTWLLMLTSVGGIGLMLRRAKRKAARGLRKALAV